MFKGLEKINKLPPCTGQVVNVRGLTEISMMIFFYFGVFLPDNNQLNGEV